MSCWFWLLPILFKRHRERESMASFCRIACFLYIFKRQREGEYGVFLQNKRTIMVAPQP